MFPAIMIAQAAIAISAFVDSMVTFPAPLGIVVTEPGCNLVTGPLKEAPVVVATALTTPVTAAKAVSGPS